MFAKRRFLRAAAGSTAAVLTLAVGFALVFSQIPSWGAEPEEASRLLPGDALFPNPTLKWTNAVTIAAPPDQVWGWIAQTGDTRAGFYSYTFIENRLARLFPDNQVVYKNAAVLVNAWQHPAPGDELMKDILAIIDLQEESGWI